MIWYGIDVPKRIHAAIPLIFQSQQIALKKAQYTQLRSTKCSIYYLILAGNIIFITIYTRYVFELTSVLFVLLSLLVHCIATLFINFCIAPVSSPNATDIQSFLESSCELTYERARSKIYNQINQGELKIQRLNHYFPVWEFFGLYLPTILSLTYPSLLILNQY